MWNQLFDFADHLDVIGAVAIATFSQPDKAAAKLADILAGVMKTVEALDAEMVRYLSLHFHDDESIATGRSVLLELEFGWHHQ